jgi:hypothetical protein
MEIRIVSVWLMDERDDGDLMYSSPEPPQNERGKVVLIVRHEFGNNTATTPKSYVVESAGGDQFSVGTNWLGADVHLPH